MILLLAMATTAGAWECLHNSAALCDPNACHWAAGNTHTYHMVPVAGLQPGVLTMTWQQGEVEDAAAAWRAGPGQRMRGADWQFVRGADQLTYDTSDMDSEVVMLSSSVFIDVCGPLSAGTEGCVVPSMAGYPGCGRKGFDLFLREAAPRGASAALVPWTEGLLQTDEAFAGAFSSPYFLEFSLASVATHEFGHMLGFDHNQTVSSTMGGYGVTNVGGELSIGEEEYDVLTDVKPHASTGNNLALSKVAKTALSEGSMWNAERWDNAISNGENGFANQFLCIGDAPALPNSVVQPIDVLHLGTAELSNVVVEWRLRPANVSCRGPGSYLLDARTIGTLNSGVPFSALPDTNLVVPPGVTAGTWTLCAKIDPDNVIAETDEGDNSVVAERVFTILPNAIDPVCPGS